MECPRRALIVERLLASALLAVALGTAWAEQGSAFASLSRAGRPWLAWIEACERGGAAASFLHLAVYEPTSRRLTLIHVPGELKLAEARLRGLSPELIPPISTRLVVDIYPLAPEDEPAVETARALKASGLRTGDRAALDPLLFALELRRTPVDRLEPARLPGDDLASAFLDRLLAGNERPADSRATTVEVLNGAGAPGLASRAAKILRSRGVDVLTTGSAPSHTRTLVYDRVGDFAHADQARAALGCPPARTITRLDPARAVDVSIALGADCAGMFGPGDGREP